MGAGDMFAGAYIYGLTQQWNEKKAAEFACHCASEGHSSSNCYAWKSNQCLVLPNNTCKNKGIRLNITKRVISFKKGLRYDGLVKKS